MLIHNSNRITKVVSLQVAKVACNILIIMSPEVEIIIIVEAAEVVTVVAEEATNKEVETI